MSPVERAKQINVYLVRMDLLRLLSVGVNLRMIFTSEKPRVAQHVGNQPRLLSVNETRTARAMELFLDMTAGRAKLEENPPAKSKNKNGASNILWFTVHGVVLVSAATSPCAQLKWSGQRNQQPLVIDNRVVVVEV